MSNTYYTQHPGKAVDTDGTFKHVMAVTLDPETSYKQGVIRCIVSREGDVGVSGFIDRSEMHHIAAESAERFKIGTRLDIKNEKEMVAKITQGKFDFIGFEDPDTFRDEKGLLHLYFTMPFMTMEHGEKKVAIYLGHAEGKDLNSLVMTEPAISVDFTDPSHAGAKELSIAPINKDGLRLNLVESRIIEEDFTYSTVRIAIAQDMGKPWKLGETVFHPKERGIPWIAGHASPGPLFSREFYDAGEGKRLGIMNGREANKWVDDKIHYGMFSVGLFIYDYENGKIDWVSPEPLIQDTEAKTVTFASQFIETGKGEGILYAHVDDSFVRAYTLTSEGVKSFINKG